MLEAGLGGMIDEEYKAHFSMSAALKSPLLIGADLRELSAQTLSIPATNWYNSTELPYAEGLKAGDKRLLGQQTGKIGPGDQIKAKVPRHAVKIYKLRSVDGGAKRYSTHKQEL
jgi:hypothetical protein